MSETLDFPEITDAPKAEVAPVQAGSTEAAKLDLAKIDLEAVALAQFAKAEADVAAAKKALTGVVHDFSTTTKLIEGKSLRQRLINGPQADMRKMTTNLKSKLTAVSKAVGTKLAAVEASFAEAEQLITPQIEAREAEIAEEKRIAAEKEAERIATIQAQIDIIRGYLAKAQAPDMTSARIQKGVELVEAMEIGEAFAELKGAAEDAKRSTLAGMLSLRDLAKAREDEAARLEAQRIENERIAAEQKAEADRLAAERAEFERQQAAFRQQQEATAKAERERAAAQVRKEAEEREAARVAALPLAERVKHLAGCLSYYEAAEGEQWQKESAARRVCRDAFNAAAAQAIAEGVKVDLTGELIDDKIVKQLKPVPAEEPVGETNTQAQDSQQVLKAEAPAPEATDRDAPATTSPSVGSMGAGQAADAAPSVAAVRPIQPTVKLGQINEMLAPFSISTAGLADLGFVATTVKGASLYRESDLAQIKTAAIAHMQGVCMRVAVAA